MGQAGGEKEMEQAREEAEEMEQAGKEKELKKKEKGGVKGEGEE